MAGSDKSYTIDNSIYESPLRKSISGYLIIELTERCNNNCIHCCINLPENNNVIKKRELSTDQWKKILQQAADLGYLTIRFTGGEPLLRTDFQELYTFTRKLGMKVILSTNARLLTPELADLFVKIPLMEKIIVTVYGMQKKTYEAVSRSPGSFHEFQRGIKLLLDRKIAFVVTGIVLPMNKEDLSKFEAWAPNIPKMNNPPIITTLLSFRFRRDSAVRNQKINQMRIPPHEVLEFLTRDPYKYRQQMAIFSQRFMGPRGNKLFSCGAGQTCVIDAYGMLHPCLFVRNPDLVFNLKEIPLKDAHEMMLLMLKKIHATNPLYLQRCAKCFLMGLCEQCPGKSWTEHGSFDKPVDYFCQVAHEQARYLGLLEKGEYAWEITDWKDRVSRLGILSPIKQPENDYGK